MGELDDPFDEALARIRAADRLAVWALVACERMAVDLGLPSPIDRIIEETGEVDPTASPPTGRDLMVNERSEAIMAETLGFLRDLRDRRRAMGGEL